MAEENQVIAPHVLLFPFPAHSHINATLKLAELFSHQRFHVTFLNTQHMHRRLSIDEKSRFSQFLGINFQTISDGLPENHPRTVDYFMEIYNSLKTKTKELFRDKVISICRESGFPVTCIIADSINTFTIDVGGELGIPVILYCGVSASCFWACFSIPKLIEAGELPLRENADMDQVINSIPGLEGLLRLRDLPSYCRVKDIDDPKLQFYINESLNARRAYAIILNTFEDMEELALAQIRAHCPIIYTIGPLHTFVKSVNPNYSPIHPSSSLWKEDKGCMRWLEQQPRRSVIYVSFGSLAVITRDEFFEFLHGLVNSGQRFLWVIRPDAFVEKDEGAHQELLGGANERGLLVEWAPQGEVLAHPSVAGFLTHSGWNSTLESVFAGIPMICCPFFADQQINSRFVSHVWKVGLDMKDSCSRVVVEKLVGELMAGKGEELEEAAGKMAELARRSVREGGSSYSNFESLMRDVGSLSLRVLQGIKKV